MSSNPVSTERSEGDLNSLDTYRTNGTGRGSSGDCPRAGSVLLEDWRMRRVLINTTCNSWRCLGCRDRNMAAFKARVSTGVSRLGRCSFTTLTYKADVRPQSDAKYVSTDWKALMRRLRRNAPWVKDLAWLRVMELTQKGTPHHHLVMGPIPQGKQIRCWRRNDKIVADWYLGRMDSCECLAHCIAREWYAVTGDSWMVHAIPVTSSKGAGAYLAKYMRKEFDGERAETLGMSRRWSTSRSWPGSKRLRLVQSGKANGWRRNLFRYGHVESDIEGGPADLLRREGDALDKRLADQRAAARIVTMIGGNDNA